MKPRSLLVVLFTLSLSQAAVAQPELRLSVGAGAGGAFFEPCGYMAPEGCTGERLRARGTAPLVLGGIRGTYKLSQSWRWRAGAIAAVTLIAPTADDRASLITGAGEIGLERGRIGFDLVVGLSRVDVRQAEMTASSLTPMFGLTLTARLTPALALFGRLDAHAFMHGDAGGTFAGAGVEWTPKY